VLEGKFGAFNLALVDPKAETAEFHFYSPRMFLGVDDDGAYEAELTMHAANIREVSFTLKPGEMRRLRAGWRDPISLVKFHLRNGEGLRFDNLVSLYE
jgi:hypothetical protein